MHGAIHDFKLWDGKNAPHMDDARIGMIITRNTLAFDAQLEVGGTIALSARGGNKLGEIRLKLPDHDQGFQSDFALSAYITPGIASGVKLTVLGRGTLRILPFLYVRDILSSATVSWATIPTGFSAGLTLLIGRQPDSKDRIEFKAYGGMSVSPERLIQSNPVWIYGSLNELTIEKVWTF